jgi:acyl carrier protein
MSVATSEVSFLSEPFRVRDADAWLRALVADRLAVHEAVLAPSVSLVDDLAADSLDLADLVVALEAELGVELDPALIDRVRTYGDLLALVGSVARERATAGDGVALLRSRLWVASGTLERAFSLDPYAIEILLEDGARAPSGARLEVVLDAGTSMDAMARIRGRLAPLRQRGIVVEVRRSGAVA